MAYNLTIIIPVRREEETITDTVASLKKHVRVPATLLIVDDHKDSSDKTPDIVRGLMKQNKHIRFLQKKPKDANGFAAALIRGIHASRGEYIVFVMADGCDDPETINRMYEKMEDGWDVVVGCRYIDGGAKVGGPLIQGFFSGVVNGFLYYVVGLPTKDSSNSFKMFRTSVLKKIKIPSNLGVEVSIEILAKCFGLGVAILDIPTIWHGRTQGESKFSIARRFPKYLRVIGESVRQRVSRR